MGSGEIKFFGQVLPHHQKVTYHLDLKRVVERKLVMGIADASMKVDGREIGKTVKPDDAARLRPGAS